MNIQKALMAAMKKVSLKERAEIKNELKLIKENYPEMQNVYIRRLLSDPARKFSKSKPVYTAKNAPRKLVIGKHDLGEFHMNDGEIGSEITSAKDVYNMVNKAWESAPHGTAIRVGESLNEPGYGLSASSAPLFFNYGIKQQKKGFGNFIKPIGEPEMVRVNTVAQNRPDFRGNLHNRDQAALDLINQRIKVINELGYDFPLAYGLGREMRIPNIGFLKYKNGGTISEKIGILQKRKPLVR